MIKNIPVKILDEAAFCPFNKQCLNKENESKLCQIEKSIESRLLKIKECKYIHCKKCINYGEGFYCLCPLRNFLHRNSNR